MKELEIKKVGAPVLREKAIEIQAVTKEVYELIRNMFFTLYLDETGVGLAAPQVGEGVRIIVIDLTPDHRSPIVMINPKLSEFKESDVQVEECLSVPGEKVPVKRATSIVAEFINEVGKPLKIQAQGLMARVIQHEVDHLDGKLIIDYISDKELDPTDAAFLETAQKEKILP